MTSFSLLLLFGHGEDSLDPKDGSNNQHALRESHHSLVRNTSLVYAESIVYPKGLLFLLDLEELSALLVREEEKAL